MLIIERAILQDAVRIAPILRQADVDELEASSGLPPLTSLLHGIGTGRSWVIRETGKDPVALFGVTPFSKTVGIPWMCGTDELSRNKRFFIQHAPAHIAEMLRCYPGGLINYIDARNTAHIRYIKHFKFQIDGFVSEYGAQKLPFYRFSMRLKGPP